eukprot:scaffold222259_cov33-Tisochrysis_lutea.AAC.2
MLPISLCGPLAQGTLGTNRQCERDGTMYVAIVLPKVVEEPVASSMRASAPIRALTLPAPSRIARIMDEGGHIPRSITFPK